MPICVLIDWCFLQGHQSCGVGSTLETLFLGFGGLGQASLSLAHSPHLHQVRVCWSSENVSQWRSGEDCPLCASADLKLWLLTRPFLGEKLTCGLSSPELPAATPQAPRTVGPVDIHQPGETGHIVLHREKGTLMDWVAGSLLSPGRHRGLLLGCQLLCMSPALPPRHGVS